MCRPPSSVAIRPNPRLRLRVGSGLGTAQDEMARPQKRLTALAVSKLQEAGHLWRWRRALAAGLRLRHEGLALPIYAERPRPKDGPRAAAYRIARRSPRGRSRLP